MKNNLWKDKHMLILIILYIAAVAIRLYNHNDNFIFFYDQTRDAQRMYDIIFNHDFKLVGPESDLPGIFHGVFFYYLIAPIYFLSNFDPNGVVIFLSLLNATGIFLVYYTSSILFNKKVGLLAAFFWTISFEQASYSRYISNPTPMSITTTLFFLGLAFFIFRKKEWGLILSTVAFALSVHLNFFLVYLIIFYPIFYVIFKPALKLKTIIVSAVAMIGILSPFIVAEIVWNLAGIKSLFHFLTEQKDSTSNLLTNFDRYLEKLEYTVDHSFFSIHLFFIFLTFIVTTVFIWNKYSEKKQVLFLLVWVFSTLPLFAFTSGVHTSPWINGSLFAGLSILFSLGIILLQKRYSNWIISIPILLILIGNYAFFTEDKFTNTQMFTIQHILYKDLKDVVDYTFESSEGKPFSICALTNPLYVNTTWSYIYGNYGRNTYGRVPYWSGQKQTLNTNNLPYDDTYVADRYLILEPLAGIPEYSLTATIYLEDQVSLLIEEKQFGEIRVQKRRLPQNEEERQKLETQDTQYLSQEEYDSIQSTIENDPRYHCKVGY